jgi:glycerate 2-kinase
MNIGSLRKHAISIFYRAIDSVDPFERIYPYLSAKGDPSRIPVIDRHSRITVLAVGKAATAMARAADHALGSRITKGIVIHPRGEPPCALERFAVFATEHPLPSSDGFRAALLVQETCQDLGANDTLLCLISGGASSLLPAPLPSITIEAKRELVSALLLGGVPVRAASIVRRHLSFLKGGKLAQLAFPAQVVGLIMSDVVGDDISSIGSGMTAADSSTFADAMGVLQEHNLLNKVPQSIARVLAKGIQGGVPETVKPGDRTLSKTRNYIVATNAIALDHAAKEAKRRGYEVMVLSSELEGEAREIGAVFGSILRFHSRPTPTKPLCILGGGETVVTVRGKGNGGRNLELALAVACEISGLNNVVFLAGATDGVDGMSPYAGAVVDGNTIHEARVIGLDAQKYLRDNDSKAFVEQLPGLPLLTGPTGTNVSDVYVGLIR